MQIFEKESIPSLTKPRKATELQWKLIEKLVSFDPNARPLMVDVVTDINAEMEYNPALK